MSKIVLYFDIEPVAKQRPRVLRSGHSYTPAKTKNFEDTLKMAAAAQLKIMPLQGMLSVKVHMGFLRPKKPVNPFPKQDIDNCLKSIFDALNGILWEDDKQISCVYATKEYASAPFISLTVSILRSAPTTSAQDRVGSGLS